MLLKFYLQHSNLAVRKQVEDETTIAPASVAYSPLPANRVAQFIATGVGAVVLSDLWGTPRPECRIIQDPFLTPFIFP